MKKLRQAKASFTSDAPPNCDEFIRRGMFICGSPETVRQTLAHHQKDIGFNILVAMMQIGSMPGELTRKSMSLLAEKVMPHLRDPAGSFSPAFATERSEVDVPRPRRSRDVIHRLRIVWISYVNDAEALGEHMADIGVSIRYHNLNSVRLSALVGLPDQSHVTRVIRLW